MLTDPHGPEVLLLASCGLLYYTLCISDVYAAVYTHAFAHMISCKQGTLAWHVLITHLLILRLMATHVVTCSQAAYDKVSADAVESKVTFDSQLAQAGLDQGTWGGGVQGMKPLDRVA